MERLRSDHPSERNTAHHCRFQRGNRLRDCRQRQPGRLLQSASVFRHDLREYRDARGYRGPVGREQRRSRLLQCKCLFSCAGNRRWNRIWQFRIGHRAGARPVQPGHFAPEKHADQGKPVGAVPRRVLRRVQSPAVHNPNFGQGAIYALPDRASSSFGQITSTSVNPRIIQFALKYIF